MAETRITYSPRAEATTETEVSVLAAVYSFVIKNNQVRRKAGESNAGGDDAREIKNACTANEKYT